MRRRSPHLVILCDGLRAPARAGFHVHLLSLARAVSAYVPTKAFCWVDSSAETGESRESSDPERGTLERFLFSLDESQAPRGGFARKRHYLNVAWRWIEAHAAPQSVIWVRGYTTAFFLWPRMSSRRHRREFTFVYDASSLLRLEASQSSLRLRGLKILAEERLRLRFDRVRTLCDSMRSHLVDSGVPAEKVLVIPVGAEERSRVWSLRGAPRRLLFVGSAQPWQGLPVLLEAMKSLQDSRPDVSLSVVGSATPGEGGPGSNVRFHGWVSRDRMQEMYLSHDLLVIPRPRSELTDVVLPMKIPEAMTYGIPMLATDLEPIRWALGPTGAFYMPEATPELLAQGIESALKDEQRLAATAASALERSREFQWKSVAKTIADRLFPQTCDTT